MADRTITATLVVALSAALVSGCTQAAPEATAPTPPAPSVVATIATTEASIEAPTEAEIVVGGTVDADLARDINRDFKSPTKAYQLKDGSYIIIDREQPLPDSVKDDIGTATSGLLAATAGDPIAAGITTEVRVAQQLTGRKVVAVVQVTIYCDSASIAKVTNWTTATAQGYGGCLGSKESATSYAQQFVGGQDDPASWDIIVG